MSTALPRVGYPRALKRFYDWIEGVGDLSGAGVATPAGIVTTETGAMVHRRTQFNFTNSPWVLIDQAGVVAYKGNKIYDFPDGKIMIFGATANIVLTKSSIGVIATWAGLWSLGTVTASNNATLTSTEADIVASTVTPAATAGVAALKGGSTSTEVPKIWDGSATAIDCFLNLLVNDTDHDVTTTPCNLILNGTLILHWSCLGDY